MREFAQAPQLGCRNGSQQAINHVSDRRIAAPHYPHGRVGNAPVAVKFGPASLTEHRHELAQRAAEWGLHG